MMMSYNVHAHQMFALCGNRTRNLLRRRVFPPLRQISRQKKSIRDNLR
jgi:hypothetical protein